MNHSALKRIYCSHSFPITRSQAKLQKIAIPSIFKPSTDRPGTTAKVSVPHGPPAVLTRKSSAALPPLDVSQNAPEKRNMDDLLRKGLLSLW